MYLPIFRAPLPERAVNFAYSGDVPKIFALNFYLFSILLLVLSASGNGIIKPDFAARKENCLVWIWSELGITALHNMRAADQGGDVRSLVNRSQPKLSRKFQIFQPKFKFYRINFLLTDSV